MSYTNPDDGITYASMNEEYHVTGYVTVRVPVDFYTSSEPDDPRFDAELLDSMDYNDMEIEDWDGLDIEIVEREWDD